LQVVVDKFESTFGANFGKTDAAGKCTPFFLVPIRSWENDFHCFSGHFDSRPSNVMDPEADALGPTMTHQVWR